MITLAQAFELAGTYLQAGHLQPAEQLYRQILQVDPQHSQAWHLLGLIAVRMARYDLAGEYLRHAVRFQPDFPEAYGNLGNVLTELGQLEEAVASYQHALRLNPVYAEAHANLGNALREQGKLEEAQSHCLQAIHLKPEFAGTYNILGLCYQAAGKPDEARASYERAVSHQPNLAEAHHNLGNVHLEQGRAAEAEACHREAVRLRPDMARMYCNLAAALEEQDKLAEAVAALQGAIRLQPELADVHCGLGKVFLKKGDLDQAMASLQEALRLQSDHAGAHNAMGIVLEHQGKPDAAIASLEKAVRCRPDHAWAHYNLGWHLLLQGDLERGWPEYEWRWKTHVLPPLAVSHPRWDGGPLHDKTIFLYAEQGLGDTLQFIRYAPLVKERGGRVVVACQPELVELVTTCAGIDRVVPGAKDLPPFDVQAPLLSLPGLCGTTLANIPAKIPYLTAEDHRVKQWRDRLVGRGGFKVGICWQGSPANTNDRRRSVPLTQFAPLAEVERVHLISLQKGPAADQFNTLAERFRVTELGSEWATFMDTAAILISLDLVVTVDTALAHLAGALGVPVWVGLPFIPDWRWLLGREDSPWYPTVRLFRQAEPGDWAGVFVKISDALRLRVGR
jgi:tetratricopeptide (TPR) repeat protein